MQQFLTNHDSSTRLRENPFQALEKLDNKHKFQGKINMDLVRCLVDEKPVVIFSRSSCCMSHSMKQLISSYGANPTLYELDETPNGNEIDKALRRIGQIPSVPALFIGQRHVGGAKEIISLQIQGKLVPMLREAKAIWV